MNRLTGQNITGDSYHGCLPFSIKTLPESAIDCIPLKRYNLDEEKGRDMLKDYLTENGRSIYAVSKYCGIPYSTLNDLANGKVKIENCKFGMVRDLAAGLGLSIDELCRICEFESAVYRNAYDIEVRLDIRGKSYYALFEYMGEKVELPLCRITEDTKYYIKEILTWRSEAYIRERRMSSWNTL